MFASISPMNAAILESVPKHLRNMAQALMIFWIHLFGDIPSPLITGVLYEYIGMYYAMVCLITGVLIGCVFYYFSWV